MCCQTEVKKRWLENTKNIAHKNKQINAHENKKAKQL